MIVLLVSYIAWFVFCFIAVVWILVLLKNRTHVYDVKTPPRKLPRVSILIPAYNEEKSIAKTIDSVLRMDYPRNLFDIIVINDCSKDKTGAIAEKYAKKGLIKLLNNKKNGGKAYSLNRAIKLCKTPYVACIDADSMAETKILKKMIGYFKDPDVAAVTPALKIWEPGNFLEKTQQAEYILNIFLRKILSFLDSVHVTPGVFSLYRRSVLLEVGGFDEENLTEDMEIALKIHQHGYKIESELGAVSYTLCPKKWKELYNQRLRWYRGAIQNTVKYRHLLFNREYGNLGLYFFPMVFISVCLTIGVFFIMLWDYSNTAINYFGKLNLIGWDYGLLLQQINIIDTITSLIKTPFILSIIGLIFGGSMLFISFNVTNEKFSGNKRGYFIYLLIFPIVYTIFWAMALAHEIAGAKRNW